MRICSTRSRSKVPFTSWFPRTCFLYPQNCWFYHPMIFRCYPHLEKIIWKSPMRHTFPIFPYPLVNVYKKLWKITMLLRTVNQLFLWAIASMAFSMLTRGYILGILIIPQRIINHRLSVISCYTYCYIVTLWLFNIAMGKWSIYRWFTY